MVWLKQGRRLQQAPANDAGLATWQYSFGEATGLQYDPFAPVGSPYAQPPVSAAAAGTGAYPPDPNVLGCSLQHGGPQKANVCQKLGAEMEALSMADACI